MREKSELQTYCIDTGNTVCDLITVVWEKIVMCARIASYPI